MISDREWMDDGYAIGSGEVSGVLQFELSEVPDLFFDEVKGLLDHQVVLRTGVMFLDPSGDQERDGSFWVLLVGSLLL
jgi:hypothetical protein